MKGDEWRRAQKLYADFTGQTPSVVGSIAAPRAGKYGVLIGTCDFLGYTTMRGGKLEKYIHKFKASDRPLFVVSPDGRQLLLLGGRFRFTERGIVDNSDRSVKRT